MILDKNDYVQKVNTMLADRKTNEELPSDPTPRYKRKLVTMFTDPKKDKIRIKKKTES